MIGIVQYGVPRASEGLWWEMEAIADNGEKIVVREAFLKEYVTAFAARVDLDLMRLVDLEIRRRNFPDLNPIERARISLPTHRCRFCGKFHARWRGDLTASEARN